ncbi:protein FAR1-RELATED SEQUENCE 5-like [Arachis duranensis]|uniref:Protein FAR1-RELATED SEQUENCE 5-like n=1 Tax=Arachis duranensis TaxID=130453 RepID=A0A9C6TGT0_ARADU|nr:protein FAR1-RELATED SEQUENCE 5-like [Arachis duranensis]
MSDSESDLDDGSTSGLSGHWTDGWSTDSGDGDDLNGLEEPLTEEGDIGHSDSEYDGRDGGGSYMHAAVEDHANFENVMGIQFSYPDPVIASVLLSVEFNGIGDAYASYVAYAKGIGFAVRKGDSIKDEEGNIVRKFFYCNRQGLREKKHYERVDRKRTHKPEMRTNCNAKLVVFLDKSCRKWRTKTLVEEHNHELAPQEFTNVMAPHRKIPEGHKAHIHSMHEDGFKTTQIMGFFAHMCGGYQNLNFISKDLYNYMDGVRQSRIVEGDAAAAINYLKGKAELDPTAVVQYSYCAEKHLGHLFWSYGNMQHDYECFGDVLAFDSTYRKNLYNRPLVIFFGTNHHRQTIIFGFGLLEDEKIPFYKWLLSSFLEVMRHKEPKVVITDGDESMREAIRCEFPSATQRLCTWHLARNAVVNIKDKDLCAAFKTAVYGHFDMEEFDRYWMDMITSFGLEDNDWVAKTYEKREIWANAYLCEKFCAGIQTTSRCKGINSSLKKFIKSGNCLLKLVENLDRVVKDYRNNEFITDYKTLYSNPVLTTGLEALERSVSKFYTRKIFYEVQKQIEGVGALLVLHRDSIGGTEKFMFRKYRKSHHVYSVFVDRSCDKYECSCKLWERLGIPCCHIFCVLKELEKEELPSRLVLRRWCKDAKVADSSSQHASVNPTDGFRVRYGALWSACLSLCFTAAQCTKTYNTAMTEVARMSREFESLGGIGQMSSRVQVGADETHILDPKRNQRGRRSGSSIRANLWSFNQNDVLRQLTLADRHDHGVEFVPDRDWSHVALYKSRQTSLRQVCTSLHEPPPVYHKQTYESTTKGTVYRFLVVVPTDSEYSSCSAAGRYSTDEHLAHAAALMRKLLQLHSMVVDDFNHDLLEEEKLVHYETRNALERLRARYRNMASSFRNYRRLNHPEYMSSSSEYVSE